ncbi:porin [Rhodobacter ferrooxidans]|uniref:Porin domain-containing protein n=1 Tax=Rhodobacter ferrooxidans TaxID=371731 RepID=C8RXB3_9RHOB|nr:porin [Rhodobacter sp. SW2]EEW26638.1 conserved hypothetical protein [Rhodobacter sp. SW2]
MKKILLATTLLVATSSIAAAEGLAVTGSVDFGLDYTDGAPAGFDNTTTIMETYLTFTGSGETDGGLSFGMEAVLAQYDTLAPDYVDDGTTVYISGAFGKLTFGDVAEADEVATLSDLGVTGIGLDNVAEALSGDSTGYGTKNAISHDVNYSYATGGLSFAVSARVGEATPLAKNDSAAVGVKYTFGDYYVGVGYNDTDLEIASSAADGATTSGYIGGTIGPVGVKAMYSSFDPELAGAPKAEAWGITADYKMDALTLTAAVADNDFSTDTSYGIGAAYDLGGGAVVKGAVGSIDNVTRAQVGMSLSF